MRSSPQEQADCRQRAIPGSTPSDWMTADETAADCEVSKKTLANWRSKGFGPPFYKIGKSVQYLRSEVHDFKLSQRVDPQLPPPIRRRPTSTRRFNLGAGK